ncbi:MAG: hypothetical protein ACXVB9_11565 [Bdellovibrionota bacterium]
MKKLIMLMLVSGFVSVSARADDEQKPKIGLNKGVANCTQVIQQVTEDMKHNRPTSEGTLSPGAQSGSDGAHSAQ